MIGGIWATVRPSIEKRNANGKQVYEDENMRCNDGVHLMTIVEGERREGKEC